jgi:ankyrin repeat protein
MALEGVARYIHQPSTKERKLSMQITLQTTSRTLFSCILCFALTVLSGCGGGAPKLTPVEQAEVDKYVKEHGADALRYYLNSLDPSRDMPDPDRILKYMKYFISQGADVKVTGKGGISPLFFAVMLNDVDFVKFLVSKGADVNAKLEDGVTPLHVAVGNEHFEVVKFLVSKGADVNMRNMPNSTLLHTAVFLEDVKFAQLLLSNGVDVNAKDSHDWTPLHLAANRSNREIVKEFVKLLVSKALSLNNLS